jgi:hypothetical protein
MRDSENVKTEDLVDDEMYLWYPTNLHRKENKPGFALGFFLKAIRKWNKEFENFILWGKPTI